jgi:Mg2+ and Co2+ transporter CorA
VTERWVELLDPTKEQIAEALSEDVGDDVLEQLAAEPAERPRPRIVARGTFLLGELVAMAPVPGGTRVEHREVDFVATAERLVVVRKTPERGEPWDHACLHAAKNASVGELVFRLIDDVAQSYLEVVDAADSEIDELEDHIDDWPSVRIRREIAELRHELINARRTVGATRGAVRRITDKRLDLDDDALFPENVERMFADTYETLFRAGEELDVARDLLASSRDYHQSLIAESQNEVAKKLTVIASLVLVPSFVVGFYGQNFVAEFNERYWAISVSVGVILASTVIQLALFRWRRWI